MIQITEGVVDFYNRARIYLEENPTSFYYSGNDDLFFAIRWGLNTQCILVLPLQSKFSEAFFFNDELKNKYEPPLSFYKRNQV